VNAATIWEIAIKVGLGKLALSLPYRPWMNQAVTDLDLTILPVTIAYADAQATLPPHHRDPFDRLIVAQALKEGIGIISVDVQLDAYGITRVW
jgi:PIN domain nuclease of toxin-antitoxin system